MNNLILSIEDRGGAKSTSFSGRREGREVRRKHKWDEKDKDDNSFFHISILLMMKRLCHKSSIAFSIHKVNYSKNKLFFDHVTFCVYSPIACILSRVEYTYADNSVRIKFNPVECFIPSTF